MTVVSPSPLPLRVPLPPLISPLPQPLSPKIPTTPTTPHPVNVTYAYYRRRGIQARRGSSALFAPTPSEMSGLFDSFLFSPHVQCFCIGQERDEEGEDIARNWTH
jgi:hypothetical protein